jgi:murein DD-endopeptidase MepM/ murein hydrolase activator NlpD
MMRKGRQRGAVLPALAVCFCAGVTTGWWLRSGAPMPTVSDTVRPGPPINGEIAAVAATAGEPIVGPALPPASSVMNDLRRHDLRLPIDDADIDAMKGDFGERRDAGGRRHEAVDILAPRNTPVHAVEDGTIAKLFLSKAGGITIYQFDLTGRYCYYYAHLEYYAVGLKEGQRVSRGDVIGYVGTSGNAPPSTPHLHFALFELEANRQWWKGRAIDPYLVFKP